MAVSRRHSGIWLEDDLILPYLAGMALIGGGFGAKLGDRLWMGGRYRVIPPDAPQHSRWSRFAAVLSIFGGITLAVGALIQHFT